MVQEIWTAHPGSFRDPAGRVVQRNGRVRRVINTSDYASLISSGLYDDLVSRDLLVAHSEISPGLIEPEIVPFVSYPYEWPFAEMKSAALATLEAAIAALDRNMMLKDASAFNVQWHNGHWKLIDTLSFTPYQDGSPWPAYTQFLQHFFYPLLFRKYRIPYDYYNLEGIPLEAAARVLPKCLRLSPWIAPNVYLSKRGGKSVHMPKSHLKSFLLYLEKATRRLGYKGNTGWAEYDKCDHLERDRNTKERIVGDILELVPGNIIDLGANTGHYTRLARSRHPCVVAVDNEHDCANSVEPLSLWADICSPSPALGWADEERESLLSRLRKFGGTIMALALLHHLCIGRNVPLSMVLELFSSIGDLIIEFVPASDTMAQKIAEGKVYPEYNWDIFLRELTKRYTLQRTIPTNPGDKDSRVICYATRTK